jgi:hypothetical protein
MDAERKERLARNEAIFREVNERIERLASKGEWLGESDSLEVLCECGNVDCAEPLKLRVSDYERVRQVPTDFLVAPGHVIPEIEKVTASGRGYEVVRKVDGEEELARETDPRS